jgi:anti-sigma regulatory factor (Ser/Thr protein kinase)
MSSTLLLEPDMSNVGAARRFVRSALEGIPREVAADLTLATSELVTNAIEHGSSEAVLLTVRADGSYASVSVKSSGEPARVPDVEDWRIAGPDNLSGRGLGMVRKVVDLIDVVRSDNSIEITVRKRIMPAAG